MKSLLFLVFIFVISSSVYSRILSVRATSFVTAPSINHCTGSHIIKIITKQLFHTKKIVGLRSSDIA
ncbi:MAG TPA: hypothetical protein VFO76_00040, partial [Candidatus Kapabacteria bacterium]|nr:hypothetical protein [Candidatus Kapabacteria bacterium]